MGGFECATHRRKDGARVDVLAGSGHSIEAFDDYILLQQAGVRTIRDGLRWHLIERVAGSYDWTSFLPMLEASIATDTQVIWDLCHWGVPEGLDIFSEEFVTRFAAFAGAAAKVVQARTSGVPFYCPVNEISFWAWIGGEVGGFYPYRSRSGDALKKQLVRASLAAMRAVRMVDPGARFVHADPVIHVVADEDADATTVADAALQTESQFETWEMLRGTLAPELGGSPEMLDILGANYYWNNQWMIGGERVSLGHPYHKPLHEMLRDLWERYARPVLITETGAEAGAGIGWLAYVAAEVRQARRQGTPVEGICLYPVMDYPGWDDGRHCRSGLIEVDAEWKQRRLREDLAADIRLHANELL